MPRHKMREYLSGYLDNELPAETRKKVEEHLKTCESCRRELDELNALHHHARHWAVDMPENEYWDGLAHSTIVRIKEQEFREVPVRARFSWQRLLPVTAAAAAAILVGIVGLQMIQNKLRTKAELKSMALLGENYQRAAPAQPVPPVVGKRNAAPAAGLGREEAAGRESGGMVGGAGTGAIEHPAAKAEQPVTAEVSGTLGVGRAAAQKPAELAAAPIAASQERRKADQSVPAGESEVLAADQSVVSTDEVDVQPVLKKGESVEHANKAGFVASPLVVITKILVEPDGLVSKVELVKSSGNDSLDQEALRRVGKYVFSPALKNGKPVRVWTTIPVRFSSAGK